jgi:hypothetical protein
LVDQIRRSELVGRRCRQQVILGVQQGCGELGKACGKAIGNLAKVIAGGVRVGLSKDRADGCGDDLAVGLTDPGQDVARDMDSTSLCQPLPESTRATAPFKAFVSIRDDQLHPGQAATTQISQERSPKSFILAVTNIDAQNFTGTVSGHADGDHHHPRHHPTIDSGLDIGRVTEDVRKRGVTKGRQRKAATCSSRSLQIRETLDLDTPDSIPNARTTSSTLRVQVPCTSPA